MVTALLYCRISCYIYIYDSNKNMSLQNKLLQDSSQTKALKNISSAFRKLFQRVSNRLHSASNSKKSSSNRFQAQLQRRKSSFAATHKRKNTYLFSQTSPTPVSSPIKHRLLITEQQSPTNKQKRQERAQRCHSDPSCLGHVVIFNKISQFNQMLITKNYFLEDSSLKSKNSREKKLFKRTSLNTKNIEPPQISQYQSKIKRAHKNKRIKFALQKEPLKQVHQSHNNKANQFQPWEIDGTEDFYPYGH